MIHVFCNSHYFSHFAAFFIVARTKRSIVKSCFYIIKIIFRQMNTKCLILKKGLFIPKIIKIYPLTSKSFSTFYPLGKDNFNNFRKKKLLQFKTNSQRVGWLLIAKNYWLFINDPSAGSPTETLLRLLLPLNDQVCPTFQRSNSVARKESQSEGFTKPFNR